MYYHENYSYWRPRPTQNDFELEVISKHPDFNGRPLRKYAVEGINTIGCWCDEPFACCVPAVNNFCMMRVPGYLGNDCVCPQVPQYTGYVC